MLAATAGCGRVGFDASPDSGLTDGSTDAKQLDVCRGSYDLVDDGGFESGSLAGWGSDDIPNLGVATLTQPGRFGDWAVEMTPTVVGSGIGYALSRMVPVVPGARYVLSAYMNTTQLSAGESFYLDLNDEPFDPDIQAATGVAGWQFVSASFLVPGGVTEVRARIVHDGAIMPSQSGFADDLAVTAESKFVAPITCP